MAVKIKNIDIEAIKKNYSHIKCEIRDRLRDFKNIGITGSDRDIFIELIFCLLTPQSSAKLCWKAVENLLKNDLLFTGKPQQISKVLHIVRFKNKKAEYICNARKLFTNKNEICIKIALKISKNPELIREWLVKNIKGLGYKEASHFLRNIGFGDDIAILDRHILKNLRGFGVIKDIPKSLSKKQYLQIEKKMRKFAKKINISLSHLDLLFWYKETGEIFK